MTKQEAIDATMIFLRQIADDAHNSVTELVENGSIREIKIYAEDLMAQARDIYRLAILLETLEAEENLDVRKEQK